MYICVCSSCFGSAVMLVNCCGLCRSPMHPRASVLAHLPTWESVVRSFFSFAFLLLHPFAHLLLLILGAIALLLAIPSSHPPFSRISKLKPPVLRPGPLAIHHRLSASRTTSLAFASQSRWARGLVAAASTTSRHRHRPPHHQHITSASPILHRFITRSSSAHHRHLGHLSAGRLTLLRNRRPRVRLPRTRCLHTTTWKPFTRFYVPAVAFSPSAGPVYPPHLDCPPFAALGATGGITMPPSSPLCAPS